MMAPRTLVSGSMFTTTRPLLEETVADLRAELHQTRELLANERFKRAQAEADAARLRRNEFLRADPHPPTGDMDKGYFCALCNTEIEWPFEQNYCGNCGKAIDWHVTPPTYAGKAGR